MCVCILRLFSLKEGQTINIAIDIMIKVMFVLDELFNMWSDPFAREEETKHFSYGSF